MPTEHLRRGPRMSAADAAPTGPEIVPRWPRLIVGVVPNSEFIASGNPDPSVLSVPTYTPESEPVG